MAASELSFPSGLNGAWGAYDPVPGAEAMTRQRSTNVPNAGADGLRSDLNQRRNSQLYGLVVYVVHDCHGLYLIARKSEERDQ